MRQLWSWVVRDRMSVIRPIGKSGTARKGVGADTNQKTKGYPLLVFYRNLPKWTTDSSTHSTHVTISPGGVSIQDHDIHQIQFSRVLMGLLIQIYLLRFLIGLFFIPVILHPMMSTSVNRPYIETHSNIAITDAMASTERTIGILYSSTCTCF